MDGQRYECTAVGLAEPARAPQPLQPNPTWQQNLAWNRMGINPYIPNVVRYLWLVNPQGKRPNSDPGVISDVGIPSLFIEKGKFTDAEVRAL